METDERAYIEDLIKLHRQRLHKLEERKAIKGVNTAPEDLIEIDTIRDELQHLEDRLRWTRATRIDLFSYVALAPLDNTTIQLDWTEYFQNGIADSATWANTLLPELHRTYQRVAQNSPEPALALRQRATITVGLAFGACFSAASGMRIWVEQRTDDKETVWWPAQEESPTIIGLLLNDEIITIEEPGDDTVIEIGITQDIRQSVDRWWSDHPQIIAEHRRFTPTSGPGRDAVPNAAHALAMARQISKAIIALHSARPHGTIHLFVATPFALAVMVGRKLNACGRVQCYDFDKTKGGYVPAGLLNAPYR